MGENKSRSGALTIALTSILLLFYLVIVLYLMFEVLDIDTTKNFVCAILFESLGFIALAGIILGNVIGRFINVGYFVTLVMVTVVYVVLLHIINLAAVFSLSNVLFFLINMILLFVYCLISAPMLIMGRK